MISPFHGPCEATVKDHGRLNGLWSFTRTVKRANHVQGPPQASPISHSNAMVDTLRISGSEGSPDVPSVPPP
uniref:Uncharacterized protein n=1 Tax=Solanum tuberosum TaxID=4113 RepID=M1DXR4_SOLTU